MENVEQISWISTNDQYWWTAGTAFIGKEVEAIAESNGAAHSHSDSVLQTELDVFLTFDTSSAIDLAILSWKSFKQSSPKCLYYAFIMSISCDRPLNISSPIEC